MTLFHGFSVKRKGILKSYGNRLLNSYGSQLLKRIGSVDARGDGAFTLMYKVVFSIFFIIVVTMIFIAFGTLLFSYKSSLMAVPSELQADVIAYRFTHSADCFGYTDETGRVYSRTVDLSKFTVEKLNACYGVTGEDDFQKYNFKLVLRDADVEIESGNYYEAPDFTLYYDVSVVDSNDKIATGLWKNDTLVVYVQKPFKDKPLSGRVSS